MESKNVSSWWFTLRVVANCSIGIVGVEYSLTPYSCSFKFMAFSTWVMTSSLNPLDNSVATTSTGEIPDSISLNFFALCSLSHLITC